MLFSEPKIPQFYKALRLQSMALEFQCSSASRKFLNPPSVQQQQPSQRVSVLFSEPKIPQLTMRFVLQMRCRVSVLFSEPKIPQLRLSLRSSALSSPCFSALQRAENSSISTLYTRSWFALLFQCSSASRKFLNLLPWNSERGKYGEVSVLFSEPKIPQS